MGQSVDKLHPASLLVEAQAIETPCFYALKTIV
jgi:hypothetical protein